MRQMTVPMSMQAMIEHVKETFWDEPRVGYVFQNCFRDTYSTTMKKMSDGTTFVITGDIPAEWLRDSTAQVRSYLLLAEKDDKFADLIEGVVKRQFQYILHDVYANAFNETPNGHGHQTDLTEMSALVWERKYELDSLCYPIQLAYLLWKSTGRTQHFNQNLRNALRKILEVWRTEQSHEEESPYRFQRMGVRPSDTLIREGLGSRVAYTGMTWSAFRPSDDACHYGYHVPSNMFAVVALRYMVEIARAVFHDVQLAHDANQLATEINHGIQTYGIVEHPEYGRVYAYETDGLGNFELMDDANVPSLLSAPYLGYCTVDDPVYLNTRRLILSKVNPFYFEGKAAKGIGSPHTPHGYVWHIALAMQGLTASDNFEKKAMLAALLHTDGGTSMMHEGVQVDDPTQYTRAWFSWANMMFCELVLSLAGNVIKGSPLSFQQSYE